MKPLDKEHKQRARQLLAEKGIEMTMEEMDRERKAAYKTIREEMRKHGYVMPDSDEDLFLLMKELDDQREQA